MAMGMDSRRAESGSTWLPLPAGGAGCEDVSGLGGVLGGMVGRVTYRTTGAVPECRSGSRVYDAVSCDAAVCHERLCRR